MPKVLTTGELLIDFSPVQIPGYQNLLCPNPGGAPANVAVQLSRLGVSSGFIGKVGRDDYFKYTVIIQISGCDVVHKYTVKI